MKSGREFRVIGLRRIARITLVVSMVVAISLGTALTSNAHYPFDCGDGQIGNWGTWDTGLTFQFFAPADLQVLAPVGPQFTFSGAVFCGNANTITIDSVSLAGPGVSASMGPQTRANCSSLHVTGAAGAAAAQPGTYFVTMVWRVLGPDLHPFYYVNPLTQTSEWEWTGAGAPVQIVYSVIQSSSPSEPLESAGLDYFSVGRELSFVAAVRWDAADLIQIDSAVLTTPDGRRVNAAALGGCPRPPCRGWFAAVGTVPTPEPGPYRLTMTYVVEAFGVTISGRSVSGAWNWFGASTPIACGASGRMPCLDEVGQRFER